MSAAQLVLTHMDIYDKHLMAVTTLQLITKA